MQAGIGRLGHAGSRKTQESARKQQGHTQFSFLHVREEEGPSFLQACGKA